MSLTNCPSCDHMTFEIETQKCSHCGWDLNNDYNNVDFGFRPEVEYTPEGEKEGTMSEQNNEQEPEVKKVYPGQLEDFLALREARQQAQQHDDVDTAHVIGLAIAEQLAGLNYILDGIRYSARNKS